MNDTIIDYATILVRLRAGDADMPWPDRRDLVTRLAEELSGDDATEYLIELVEVLAGDPKWEVRRDIADMLLLLPETDFVRLAARLTEDSNAFVRSAAERAIARHRKGQRQIERASEGRTGFRFSGRPSSGCTGNRRWCAPNASPNASSSIWSVRPSTRCGMS